MAVAADNSLPLAVSVQSASPHESQLVEEVLASSFLEELPAKLIGDRAYDSDPLDRKLADKYGIQLIAPHRSDRKHKTQDGHCGVTRDAGGWNDFSLGSSGFVAWSRDTSTTSKTFSE